MQLVEKGKVSLDDPAEKYVPEVRQIKGYTPFTLRQLASHTAGLQREPGLKGRDVGPVDQWAQKVLECLPYTSYVGRRASSTKLPRLAQGISNDKDGHVNLTLAVSELKGRGYRIPNGGIFSTPADLAKFVLSLVGVHPLLQAISLQTMRIVPPGGQRYGLGGLILMRNVNSGHTELERTCFNVLQDLTD